MSPKNDTDVAHYNFNSLFGRNFAERVYYRKVVIPPLLTNVSALPRKTWISEMAFSVPYLKNDDASVCYIFDTD